jgi:hypothetical protein
LACISHYFLQLNTFHHLRYLTKSIFAILSTFIPKMGLVWSSPTAQPMTGPLGLRTAAFITHIASGMGSITAPRLPTFRATPMMMLFGSIRDKHQRHFRTDFPTLLTAATAPAAAKTWTLALNESSSYTISSLNIQLPLSDRRNVLDAFMRRRQGVRWN